MKPESLEALNQLYMTLNQLIKVYRGLLNVVRREKEILISANLDDLNKNNQSKETILVQVHALENQRIEHVKILGNLEGLGETPRLSELAVHFSGEHGDRLHQIHSVLDLLVKRVQEFNKQNETLIHSALENITGAMKVVRDQLGDRSTYKRKGVIDSQPAPSGQLVSREV